MAPPLRVAPDWTGKILSLVVSAVVSACVAFWAHVPQYVVVALLLVLLVVVEMLRVTHCAIQSDLPCSQLVD